MLERRPVLYSKLCTDAMKNGRLRPPREIQNLIFSTSTIQRFAGGAYPEEAFKGENVLIHTRRLVASIAMLNMPEGFNKEEAMQMAWGYDLVETKTGDESLLHQLNNPGTEEQKFESEIQIAQQILPKEYSDLFLQFEKAKRYWKGSEVTADNTAKTVKLLDWFDGNITFHERMARYCAKSGNYSAEGLQLVFDWAFVQEDALRPIMARDEHGTFFGRLLDNSIYYIRRAWEICPDDLRPEAMKKHLIIKKK